MSSLGMLRIHSAMGSLPLLSFVQGLVVQGGWMIGFIHSAGGVLRTRLERRVRGWLLYALSRLSAVPTLAHFSTALALFLSGWYGSSLWILWEARRAIESSAISGGASPASR